MLLDDAVVAGQAFPRGALGTEEDFGDDLDRLLREGMLIPFDPRCGIPPIPPASLRVTIPEAPAKVRFRSRAYADHPAR
jgi:hypothetical protein